MRRVEVNPMHSPLFNGGNDLFLPRSSVQGARHDPSSSSPSYPAQPSEGGIGDCHLEHTSNTNGPAVRPSGLFSFYFSSRSKVDRGILPKRSTRPNLYWLGRLLF